VSERVSNFSDLSWREQVTFRWDYDDDCFLQYQQT